ncbi:MAG: YjjG family noncanonical pyrimidine nucleotidase, partial [Chitinophagales bacterium]
VIFVRFLLHMKSYKNVFFDLDETLWDFKTNSQETLSDVFEMYRLSERGVMEEEFYVRFQLHNNYYWDLFRKGTIAREELRIVRFSKTLLEFNVIDDVLTKNLSESYLHILPTKTRLYDDALEVLNYLKAKYSLHIITNGFEEVQFRKLHHSGITPYFKYVITSEMAGSQKPNREIFKYAFNVTNASAMDSIFIGDSIEADIHGAKSVGMDHVLFNPEKLSHNETVMHEVSALRELKGLL